MFQAGICPYGDNCEFMHVTMDHDLEQQEFFNSVSSPSPPPQLRPPSPPPPPPPTRPSLAVRRRSRRPRNCNPSP